ncbi:MAG: ATP phosphoribosyltransferase [Candidatus Lokiarchaeota archaeon]|nr:ATP phosphoribosyltransferase [Candidatus Lokiarchaeota archaeon]MBD3202326.1 ATP phosphoribosyltransferase [Candidatus Lokiarchaeota archaeon]
MNENKKKLKFTIPKGSLQSDVTSFFERAGLKLRFSSSRDYRPSINDPELEIKLLRPQEIPNYLIGEDEFDLGISGKDWIQETNADVEIVLDLEIGEVRIVFSVPNTWEYISSLDDVLLKFNEENKIFRISTEYLTLSLNYIRNNNTYKKLYGDKAPLVITPWRTWGENSKVKIFLSFGATEAKPPEEVDAIIDNTQTGSTLRANNLRIVEIIDTSTAVLIANKNAFKDDWKKEKIKDLKVLLMGVIEASKKLHIFMNVRSENLITLLDKLPALKRPTVSKLSGDHENDWYAINTIIKKSEFLSIIPILRKYAQGLVVHEPRQILPLGELS